MAHEHALAPLQIGNCTLPNRIARAAHQTGLGRGGISEAFIAYHEARARGGVGLSVLEISAVHPSSPTHLLGYDDALHEGYARMLPRMHEHGMRVFQQLWHGGHHSPPADGGPPWSASDVASVSTGLVPHPMTVDEIAEVTRAFAEEARRCRDSGIDGVELHFAHGYLVGQFLSPLTNRRSDEYGGSLENRTRFAHEILLAVRASVGPGYPVGVRLSAEECVSGGIPLDETIETARSLEATGALDFIDVSLGNYIAFDKVIGAMHEAPGYEIPLAAKVTRSVDVPTLVTGRILTLDHAEAILERGDAAIVSMVRATIADSDLVSKTRQGRAEEVRPCLGCNQACVGGVQGVPGHVSCVGNPWAGYESRLDELTKAPQPRTVWVVGAGAAGLEAARTAALRGHQVDLFEAEQRMGGQLELARQSPHRDEIGAITDWLQREVTRLGVDVHLGCRVDAKQIRAAAPDFVIIATGSIPRTDGLQFARPGHPIEVRDGAKLLTSREVIEQPAPREEHILVVDELGHYEAAGIAEGLLDHGNRVTVASRFQSLSPLLDLTLQSEALLARLHASGRFRFAPRRALAVAGKGTATLVDLDAASEEELEIDRIVLVSPPIPDASLAEEELGEGCVIHTVGDARGPRFLQAAIHEGHHAARSIE